MSQENKAVDSLDFQRLSLYTPAPGVEKERSSMNWSMFMGNPRCTVWTRVDDDVMLPTGKKKGPIAAGIGQEALEGIVEQALKLFSEEGRIDTIIADTVINPTREDGSKSYDKVVNSSFVFGRGEDGVCFVGLKSADGDRPEIIFYFKGFEWHPLRRKSGPFTESELSSIQARAWFKHLEKACLNTVRGVTPEERKANAERRKAAREGRKPAYNNQSRPSAPKQDMTATGGFDSESYSF